MRPTMNISYPIRRQAQIVPHASALVLRDGSRLTYATLDRAIDNIVVRLVRLGLVKGDLVSLRGTKESEAIALVIALALLRMGVTVATGGGLSPNRAKFVFADVSSTPSAPPSGVILFDRSWLMHEGQSSDTELPPMAAGGDTVGVIFSSSGTTGHPKNVAVSHALMAQRVFDTWLGDGGGPVVKMLTISPLGAWGLTAILNTWWQGGTVVFSEWLHVVETMRRERVTWLAATPTALADILDAIPDNLPIGAFDNLTCIEVGGSHVPERLKKQASARLCANVVVALGSSEANRIASAPYSAPNMREGSVGFVWPSVEVQAVDDQHRPVPLGEAGIIRLRGPMVVDGYFEDDEASAAAFRDGWFYPGDLGRLWPDGQITLTGRINDVLNIGGIKFDPRKMEEIFLSLPGVMQAAIFPVADEFGLQQVGAAIVPHSKIPETVLNAFCKKAFPQMPLIVVLQMRAFPRNENGKIGMSELMRLATQVLDNTPSP